LDKLLNRLRNCNSQLAKTPISLARRNLDEGG